MKIKKGDNVLVVRGKDRGKKGKIIRALPKESRVVVEGANLRKRHVRPRKQGAKGEIVSVPAPLHVSDVRIVCSSCSKLARIGQRTEGGKKVRVCLKCGNILA